MRGIALPYSILALLMFCRMAMAGEILSAVPGDPLHMIWRVLIDGGPMGLFVAYLIYRDHKRDKRESEYSEREEERRKAASERFHALDKQLVGVIEKYSISTAGVENGMREVRMELFRIYSIITTGRVAPGDDTRIFRKE